MNCIACQPPCATCLNNVVATQCASCIAGKLLLVDKCVDTCPDGYYSNGIQCLKCVSPCQKCTDITTCLSCDNNQSNQFLEGT